MSGERRKDDPGLKTCILDLLECPVCMETCVPPIKCCVTGHNICHVCVEKVSKCPICRESYSGTRNFMAEQLYESMKQDSKKQAKPMNSAAKQMPKPNKNGSPSDFTKNVNSKSCKNTVEELRKGIVNLSIDKNKKTRSELRLSARENFLATNLVKNHSGASGMEFWTDVKNCGADIHIENPPADSNPLPIDAFFPDSNICFKIKGDSESEFRQKIDLWEHGFRPETLLNLLPFRIEVSEKCTAEYYCGGTCSLSVVIGDEKGSRSLKKKDEVNMTLTRKWVTLQLNFDFEDSYSSENIIRGLRYITFTHGGKGSQNVSEWRPYYNIKVAHASVRIVLLG